MGKKRQLHTTESYAVKKNSGSSVWFRKNYFPGQVVEGNGRKPSEFKISQKGVESDSDSY